MKKLNILFAALAVAISIPSLSFAEAEYWKGNLPNKQLDFGLNAGLGVLDGSAGFAFLGQFAYRIAERGFAPDINNQPFVEVMAGPLLISNSTAFVYSAHVRWNFNMTEQFGLYGLGGVGGVFAGQSLGNLARVFPRFGAGLIYRFTDILIGRFELSHEFSTLGISFAF